MWIIILALCVWSCQAYSESDCYNPNPRGGFIHPNKYSYENGEIVHYGCNKDLKPARAVLARVTCRNRKWVPEPLCIPKSSCLPPLMENGGPTSQMPYYPPGTVYFTCEPNYDFENRKYYATCEDGSWKGLPVCKRFYNCPPPPRIDYGMINGQYKDVYRHGDSVQYVCANGYNLNSVQRFMCENGNWPSRPSCVSTRCAAPTVPNAQVIGTVAKFYPAGSQVKFICNSGYTFVDSHYATCVSDKWELPVCEHLDTNVCISPHVPNGQPVNQLAAFYPSGRKVKFQCNLGYEFKRTDDAVCVKGEWKLPVCTEREEAFFSSVTACGAQPLIQHAVVDVEDRKLKIQCVKFHKLVGPETVRCVNKKWTDLPECKPPCKLEETGDYLEEGEEMKVSCKLIFVTTYKCVNGETQISYCKSAIG